MTMEKETTLASSIIFPYQSNFSLTHWCELNIYRQVTTNIKRHCENLHGGGVCLRDH